MRSSLSASTITKAFVKIQCAVRKLGGLAASTPSRDVETPSEISVTENVNITSNVFRRMLSKLAGTA